MRRRIEIIIFFVFLASALTLAQEHKAVKIELTQNAILAVLPEILSRDQDASKVVLIHSKLRYRLVGPDIARLRSQCLFCDWELAIDSLDMPDNWFRSTYENTGWQLIISDEDSREGVSFNHFFSPLIPTKIKNHYIIQCNSFRYGERHYRLILLSRKGMKFKFISYVYNKYTVF